MKKSIIVSVAALAGGALATYLFKRFNSADKQTAYTPKHRSHHLTDSFARAKQSAAAMG